MRQLAPALPNLPLLLLLLAHSPFAFPLPQGSSQVVRSIFPSFSPFPCPSPPSVVWARPAAAALLDWSRATTGTAVVATFDGHYLATFEASAGDMVVMHLPPDRFLPGYVVFALILLHACLLADACGREHELLLMTVDEQGDDCAPQVVTRFNVSDCSQQQPIISSTSSTDPPSAWSILQRDATFGAGWPSAFYVRLHAAVDPSFSITPPPIETRMHAVMDDIFAGVVVPEYAQLMGVNLRAPAAGDDASRGSGSRGSVDDFKYIPIGSSYVVSSISSFVFPPPITTTCPAPPLCSGSSVASTAAQPTCEATAHAGSGRTAVVTLITSDSYLHGALVLLCATPPRLLSFTPFATPTSLLHPPPPATAVAHTTAHPCSHGISSRGCVPHAAPLALVTEKVTETVRVALAAAGWGVMAVDAITSAHPSVGEERWRDNYSKLHLFALQVEPCAAACALHHSRACRTTIPSCL